MGGGQGKGHGNGILLTINGNSEEKVLSMFRFQTPKNCLFPCGHVKINFHVLNNLTKKDTRQNMLGFRRDGVLASKIAKVL